MTKEKLEKFLFVILNLILSSYNLSICLVFLIGGWVGINILNGDPSANDLPIIISSIIAFPILWLIKILIFPILYKRKNSLSNIYIFFNKFLLENKFRFKILSLVIVLDVTMLYVPAIIKKLLINGPLEVSIQLYIVTGGGVLISYLSLIVWYWFSNKKKKFKY